MSNEPQDLAETRHGEQAAVLRVCNLPYFAQDGGGQLGALEEFDCDFACDDAELFRVGLLEEVLEDALLLGGQVEDGLVWGAVSWGCEEGRWREDDALSSLLPARSAMAARCGAETEADAKTWTKAVRRWSSWRMLLSCYPARGELVAEGEAGADSTARGYGWRHSGGE